MKLWFIYCPSKEPGKWVVVDRLTRKDPIYLITYELEQHADLDVAIFNEYYQDKASPAASDKVDLLTEIMEIYRERGKLW